VANALDRSVDWALGSIRKLDADATREAARLQRNRAAYASALRSLGSIRTATVREQLRAQLGTWIRTQLAAESRVREFLGRLATVKASVKAFLRSVRIEPPGYLGALPLVPLVVAGAVAVALTTIAAIAVTNARQQKSIDGLNALIASAASQGWSSEETARAIQAFQNATAAAAPPGDPFGISSMLRSALPLVLGVGAVLFLMQTRRARGAAS